MGVEFPVSPDGRRSTSALGRAVVAAALRDVDPEGSKAAEHESNWRRGYLHHFRRLIEAGLPSAEAARSVARGGLGAVHQGMRLVSGDGAESELATAVTAPAAGQPPVTVTVTGDGKPERDLAIPYRGERLTGDGLLHQLDDWIARGIIEPSCAEAIGTVAAHPDWLAVPGQTVVVLGAGAEVGPLPALLSWGAHVVGVDLPGAPLWTRVLETARGGAGTLEVPLTSPPAGPEAGMDLAEEQTVADSEPVDDRPIVDFSGRGSSDYTEEHARVFTALTQAQEEHNGEAVYLDEIADAAGVSKEDARVLLHDLTTEQRLVTELEGSDDPDLGPRFEVKPRL